MRLGRCYKLFPDVVGPEVAYETCRNNNAKMAEPKSDAENIALTTAAEAENGGGVHWIGLTDKYVEGQWVYRSDKNMAITYDNWHPVEPSNSGGGGEQYAVFNIHSDPYLWTDWPLSNTGKIICEKPVCPQGWTLVRGRCYYLGTDIKTANDAEAYCISQGGKLFEPENAEDNSVISSMMSAYRFWIGINDKASPGTFVTTSDGSVPLYINFHANQPDNAGTEECVHSNWQIEGQWNDHKCNTVEYAYVCQLGGG